MTQGITTEFVPLWLELALIAGDHHDWPVMRRAYQAAAAAAVLIREPQRQIDVYWQWGQTECLKSKHRDMGLSLMQWALALVQTYAPDQSHHYERTLKQMRAGVTA
jgi:hypothetical protein